MKKSLLIVAGIVILIIIGIVISNYFPRPTGPLSPECYSLPAYADQFVNYYEDVEINRSSCYQTFRFETPLSYSNFGIRYTVTYGEVQAGTIEEFDAKIREKISIIESCPDFEEYSELSIELYNGIIPINYLLVPPNDSCTNLSAKIEREEKVRSGQIPSIEVQS